MKKFLLMTCLVAIPGLALAQYYQPGTVAPPPGAYYHDHDHDRFEHHKWDELHSIDAQINNLRAKRGCVEHAGDWGMLHACDNPAPPPVVVAQPAPVVVAPPPQNNLVLGVHIH